MVEGRVEGLLRHGVDDAARDELRHVERVREARVLDARRRPQGALQVRTGRQECLRAVGREGRFERLVRELSVRDTGLALEGERLVGADGDEPLVDLSVDARDEERCDRLDARKVDPCGPGLLEPCEVGVDDLAVALEAEDQRDVDADACGDGLGDGFESLDRRRDLDEDVGLVDLGRQLLRLCDRSGGVVCKARFDLDRHAAVETVRGFEDRVEEVARVGYVVRGDLEDGVDHVRAGFRQFADLVVVRLALG